MASVLILDDDPLILSAIKRIAKDLPAAFRFTGSIREAWAALDAEVPDILVADYRLPDGDGLSLLEKVQVKWPAVKCVLHTGEAVNRTAVGLDLPVIAKPCPPESLRELLSGLISELPGTPATKT